MARLCLAGGFDTHFIRRQGPISQLISGLTRLGDPDLVLVIGEETQSSWLVTLENRMSPGAILALLFPMRGEHIEGIQRPDQLISILKHEDAFIPLPHRGTAPGVLMATRLFLERLEVARREALKPKRPLSWIRPRE